MVLRDLPANRYARMTAEPGFEAALFRCGVGEFGTDVVADRMGQVGLVNRQAASRAGQDLMLAVERLGKPVIAKVQGYALGGGMELAMACHIRVASEKARFGQPEIGLGLIPGFGGTQRLTRLAGRGAALELCLLGQQIDAARAERLGIVARVVPAEELDTTVDAMADQLAAAAPLALKGILEAVLEGGECAIDQGLAFETQGFAIAFSTDDMREGTSAFLERRKPSFKGS